MNSLQELNNFGLESFDYVDARPSGVSFDRQFPLTAVDQEVTINSTSLTPEPGINILEVINYQTANVRYRVTIETGFINPLVGSSIAWDSLPSGISLTQVGNQYTLSGIHSAADWNAIKYFTWNLPAAYASYPLWYLTVEIIYYDSKLNQDVISDWIVYDDRFFYVAQLNSSSNINAIVGVNSPANANLTSSANIFAQIFNFVRFTSNLTASAAVDATIKINNTELIGKSTINSIVGVLSPASATLTGRATPSITVVTSVNNLIPRSYIANRANGIFATNTPQLDTSNSSDTFTITLTSNVGQFALNSSTNPQANFQISGTKSAVNSAMNAITFFPTVNVSSNGTYTWQQARNGIVEFTRSYTLTGNASNFVQTTYTFSSAGTYSWTPTYSDVYYGSKIDFLLVAGGGAGGDAQNGGPGGGGGGGFAKETFNYTIGQQAYSLTVGARGLRNVTNDTGYVGGGFSTVGFGTTVYGGTGGRNGTRQNSVSRGGAGGNSGLPSDYSQTDPLGRLGWISNTRQYGGGGAGSSEGAQFGGAARGPGGNGLLSNIPPIAVYVGGGGGGGSNNTTQYAGGLGQGGSGGITVNGIGQNGNSAGQNLGGGGGGGATHTDAANLTNGGLGGSGGQGYIAIRVHT